MLTTIIASANEKQAFNNCQKIYIKSEKLYDKATNDSTNYDFKIIIQSAQYQMLKYNACLLAFQIDYRD
jgi:hypothetical protein